MCTYNYFVVVVVVVECVWSMFIRNNTSKRLQGSLFIWHNLFSMERRKKQWLKINSVWSAIAPASILIYLLPSFHHPIPYPFHILTHLPHIGQGPPLQLERAWPWLPRDARCDEAILVWWCAVEVWDEEAMCVKGGLFGLHFAVDLQTHRLGLVFQRGYLDLGWQHAYFHGDIVGRRNWYSNNISLCSK